MAVNIYHNETMLAQFFHSPAKAQVGTQSAHKIWRLLLEIGRLSPARVDTNANTANAWLNATVIHFKFIKVGM
jgi:hypothetical protein